MYFPSDTALREAFQLQPGADCAALKHLRAAIQLSRLPGVGAKKFKAFVDLHGSPIEALKIVNQQVTLTDSAGKTALTCQQLDELLNLPEAVGFTYYGAADYPRQLAELSEPPPYLFYDGTLWPLPPMLVAIVGPRDCSDEGASFAQAIAAQLAAQGVVIVSGGAFGIDTAAHCGALEAGGFSILVTATGIDRVYPAANNKLFVQTRERGCILTELLPGTPPRRDFFPTRNRIIVGLSYAVIIVEGKSRTGTWSSANHALRQQRQIFTWLKSPRSELRELPNLLIKRGAIPLNSVDSDPIMALITRRQP
ncbi:DNA processing protein [Gammaproteobacteria bacterium]